MNLDYERNVCFTEATNSGLFTKKKLKRKKYHFTWILKRFMVSKNFHVTSFQYWCHVSQTYQAFQIFGKIITRCRLIEIQQNVTFEIEGHFLSIFLTKFQLSGFN